MLKKVDLMHQTLIFLLNKSDLCSALGAEYVDPMKNTVCEALGEQAGHVYIQTISAKTGQGLDQLRQTLSGIEQVMNAHHDAVLVTNVRHFEALKHAFTSLEAVHKGLDEGIPTDLVAQDLREALYYLGSITGEITTEEVLGSIFGRFCIGK